MKRINQVGLLFVFALFLISGVSHFLLTRFFLAIMPPYLPWPYAAVYVSGAFEIIGAIGLVLPAYRRAAGIGLLCPDHSRDAGQYSYGAQSRAIPRFFHKPALLAPCGTGGPAGLDLRRRNPTATTQGPAERARHERAIGCVNRRAWSARPCARRASISKVARELF